MSGAHIVIAVGTRSGAPPGAVADGVSVVTSDGVTELAGLPKTMAVVGAGVIGIEYASMFAGLGVSVTVIDGRARPLEFLDHEIVDELIHQMRKHGVTFRLGEFVEGLQIVEQPQRRAVMRLQSGKQIAADLVLFSAGRVGATAGLNLEAVGLTVDERGRLRVDTEFRTQVPHIFAAGDVIGYPSLAATSAEQGRLAACHAFGVLARPMGGHFPIGIYSVPEISMVGAAEHALTADPVPYDTGVARYREIARGQIVGDESGLFKMRSDRAVRRATPTE